MNGFVSILNNSYPYQPGRYECSIYDCMSLVVSNCGELLFHSAWGIDANSQHVDNNQCIHVLYAETVIRISGYIMKIIHTVSTHDLC